MLANITGDWPWLLLVVLVVFGGSQLPKLAKNAGEAMKEFRNAHNEATNAPGAVVPAAPAVAATPVAAAMPPVVSASVPSAATSAAATSSAPVAPASGEELVTLTRAQLDAILATKTQESTPGSSTAR